MQQPSVPEPSEVERDQLELAALRAGDEAAFLELVNRHQPAMVRVAQRYVRTRAIADEVVQEAWLGVLKGLERFEGRSSLKSWIFSILVNCAKSRALREGSVSTIPMVDTDNEAEGPAVSADRFIEEGGRWAGHWSRPPEPWPDARVQSSEMVALVRKALETLPAAQRAVMSLRDVEGLGSDETCQVLGISEANQRVLLHRARSKVRAFLEERLGREVLS